MSTLHLFLCGLSVASQAAPPAPAQTGTRSRQAAAPHGTMTNADVVKMVKAGLSETVVITAVRHAKATAFALDPDALIDLKRAGVSDAAIAAMADPGAQPATTPAPPSLTVALRLDPNDPIAPHDAGVYIDIGANSPQLVALEPTSFKQGKSGGLLGSAMTFGIKKMKWKAVVRSPRALQRTRAAAPTFYFYFEKKSSIDGGASNPGEFVLARMSPKNDTRELIVGEAGAFGGSSGAREKDTVEFRAEKVAPGVYKVTPSVEMKPGEYCFFMATGSANPGQAGATGRLFDFGVDG